MMPGVTGTLVMDSWRWPGRDSSGLVSTTMRCGGLCSAGPAGGAPLGAPSFWSIVVVHGSEEGGAVVVRKSDGRESEQKRKGQGHQGEGETDEGSRDK